MWVSSFLSFLDLYIRAGSAPSVDIYDCRSWNSGTSNELCESEASDSLVIGVFGYRSGSYTLNLSGELTGGGTTDGGTTDGVIAPGQSISGNITQGDWLYFEVTNPVGVLNAVATLTELSADIDLYVKVGAVPTDTDYDYRSWVGGNNDESCGVNLSAGTNWIGINGYQAGSFTLSVSSGTQVALIGANGSSNSSVALSTWNYYQVQGSAGLASVVADLSNLTADGDLYLKVGALPSLTDFDCRSFFSGTANENCSVSTNGTTVFVGVYGYQASDYSLSVLGSAAAQRKPPAKSLSKEELTRDLNSKALLNSGVSVGGCGGGSPAWPLLSLLLLMVYVRRGMRRDFL